MDASKIPLYCLGCDKELEVPEEDFRRLHSRDPGCFDKKADRYHYRGGCFYKNAVLLRRRPEAYQTLCGGEK